MEQGVFMIRLCSDHAAYEAVPKRKLRIDIPKLRLWLVRRGGCEVALWTPSLIVVKWRDEAEVTVVDDGRMIIRNVAGQEDARRIAETILPEEAIRNS